MSEWDWLDRAACRGDLQFADRPRAEQLPTCRRCPVQFECLELGVDQAHASASCSVGYGGKSADEVLTLARGRSARPHSVRCVECGIRFEARSSSQLYCTKSCRQRAYETRLAVAR